MQESASWPDVAAIAARSEMGKHTTNSNALQRTLLAGLLRKVGRSYCLAVRFPTWETYPPPPTTPTRPLTAVGLLCCTR